jgi:hypothetical protein
MNTTDLIFLLHTEILKHKIRNCISFRSNCNQRNARTSLSTCGDSSLVLPVTIQQPNEVSRNLTLDILPNIMRI